MLAAEHSQPLLWGFDSWLVRTAWAVLGAGVHFCFTGKFQGKLLWSFSQAASHFLAGAVKP